MNVLKGYQPEKVFEYFELLCSVPHGSGNTKEISDLCCDFARKHSLSYVQDSLNNVIIYKDGTEGYEKAEPIILQGHIDMVCAKDDSCTKDMEKEGIDLCVENGRIKAIGTSLGGDNAVAVAIILAILDSNDIPHPPIEAVLTVDEETGMYGAKGLDFSLLKGKRMINLDSEEEGVFTAGCAGGGRVNCSIPCQREAISGYSYIKATISGLLSGHSGVDIDKGRGSSNRMMGRMLFDICEKLDMRLCKMEGGELDNVIPKLTYATICVPEDQKGDLCKMIEDYAHIYKNELASSDPDVTLQWEEAEPCPCVTREDTVHALTTMIMLPYHVQDMSMDLPGLVQTSLNMGILRLKEESLDFSFAVRSCIKSAKEDLIRRVRATVEYMGGTVVVRGEYPAWEFAKNSPLRDLCLQAYKEQTGKEGTVFATHGGLECGLFSEAIPGLDCISFGPDLSDVHSVRESLSIESTARLYYLVCAILEKCR